jgi:hypothetical protein
VGQRRRCAWKEEGCLGSVGQKGRHLGWPVAPVVASGLGLRYACRQMTREGWAAGPVAQGLCPELLTISAIRLVG